MPKACCGPPTWRCFAPRSSAAIASRSTVRRSTTPRRSASASSSRCGARSRAGELLLMYQPHRGAARASRPRRLEALLRWRKPDGRIATATEFIHVAEKTGLIHELTDWVLRSAASAAAALARARAGSAPASRSTSRRRSSSRAASSSRSRARSRRPGCPPSALELEITETVVPDRRATIESLRQLRALGVPIALDDFGIGYSSLTSLEQLPITRVKLDRLLVAGVDTNPRSAAIVRSIVALCHGLGLQVVAEGVERAAQLDFLAQCGPLGVQGYLLAHPVEAAAAASEAQAAAERARRVLAGGHAGRPRRCGRSPRVRRRAGRAGAHNCPELLPARKHMPVWPCRPDRARSVDSSSMLLTEQRHLPLPRRHLLPRL